MTFESYIFCPTCRQQMIKMIDKKCIIVYERCPTCRSIWLDPGELQEIKEGKNIKTIKRLWKIARKERKNATFPGIFYPGLCPKCKTGRLVKTQKKRKIAVDECEECKGLFIGRDKFGKLLGEEEKGLFKKIISKLKGE